MVAFRARDETVDAATCFVFPGLSRCAAWIRCEDLGHAFWSLGGWRLAGADGCDPDEALGPEPAGEPMKRPSLSISRSYDDMSYAGARSDRCHRGRRSSC